MKGSEKETRKNKVLTGDDGGYETREIIGNSTLKKLVCKGPGPEKDK